MKYNEAQQKAILDESEVTRVIAGAGTGKTQVMAGLVCHLLLEKKVRPEEILLITFSKSGANELKSRCEKMLQKSLSSLRATTFHALENEIALDNWEKLGFRHRMSVIDEVQDLSICDTLFRRYPIYEWKGAAFSNYNNSSSFGRMGALRILSNTLHAVALLNRTKVLSAISAGDVLPYLSDSDGKSLVDPNLTRGIIEKMISMYPEYERMKKGFDPEFPSPVITFDEQIALCLQILRKDPDYLDQHYDFSYILVDEAQDTSLDQIAFLNFIISMKKFKKLTIVGDDSQAIYESMMHTSPKYLIEIENYLHRIVKVSGVPTEIPLSISDVVLDLNYRCRPEILTLANRVISRNKNKYEKELKAARKDPATIDVKGFYRKHDEKETKKKLEEAKKKKIPVVLEEGEVDTIVRDIKACIEKGVNPNEIAYIAYSKSELKDVADMLTEQNIPSKFGAPELLMQNHRILALIKFSSILYNETKGMNLDFLEIANALRDGFLVEDRVLEEMKEIRSKADLIHSLPAQKAKEGFLSFAKELAHQDEAVLELLEKLKDMEFEEILQYLHDFTIYGDQVSFKRSVLGDGVMLITAHSAKGLEWNYVFGSLTGFHKKDLSSRRMEEFRRLLFVLITRARDELHLYSQYAAYKVKSDFGAKATKTNVFLEEVYEALSIPCNPKY